jgi:hypothetical protein
MRNHRRIDHLPPNLLSPAPIEDGDDSGLRDVFDSCPFVLDRLAFGVGVDDAVD